MKLRALDPLLYPLEEDLLYRNTRFVDRCHDLIAGTVEPPYAISIDGLWGSGKTTLMKLLQAKLDQSGHPVFWFNPWEYRQTENVVLAFLQCLAADQENLLRRMEKSSGTLLRVLLESGMDAGLKFITRGTFSLKDIAGALKSAEEPGKIHEQYRNTIKTITAEFVALVNGISADRGGKSVVVFFDDLDRCLPEDTIQLLEAMKNLFVTPGCNAVFVCGIDTRIAKQFIAEHYKGIGETFSINYFRKIFNLTLSMPYSPDIYSLLVRHVQSLYDWEDPEGRNADALARTVYTLCLQSQIYSVRKYLNILNNFYIFLNFNPDYQFDPDRPLIIYLLVFKEAWQPLFEELVQEAFRERANMAELIPPLTERLKQRGRLSSHQERFLVDYLGNADAPFAGEYLSELLVTYLALV